MPTTYSHMAFGESALQRLAEDPQGAALQNALLPWKNDFQVGLHGPDILFYYHALIPNPVSRLGHRLHSYPAGSLFVRLGEVAKESGAGFAYALGVICHYILDYRCHPYVEAYKDRTGISHGEIELEMDWSMMKRDGYDPMSYRPAEGLHLTPELLKPLERVYLGVSSGKLEKAVRSMVFYCGLGVCPQESKRRAMTGAMKLLGLGTLAKGHVMCPERNPGCDESTAWLCQKLEETVGEAVWLMKEYSQYVRGERPLPALLRQSFMGPV